MRDPCFEPPRERAAALRAVVFHGHFYQPPRDNPWMASAEIEVQDSAAPYHDWNERITVECYGPNTAARILGPDGNIVDLVDNYEHISFNIGPTLISWLEQSSPAVYEAILEADRRSALRLGHGNAIAQAYGHCILPLANRRDKVTQVRWAIADFEHRFHRRPEGIWLPECAVDEETLCVLADEGIRFTILGPTQSLSSRRRRVNADGHGHSVEANPARDGRGGADDEVMDGVDPRRPYRALLPGARFVDIFFYDGYVARSIAFEDGLRDAETFAGRLLAGFDQSASGPQLVSVAVDGETFGHHRPFGDMALAATVRRLQASAAVEVTNYAAYLAHHPPQHEVQLRPVSAWSCAHGVDRWRDDCGCVTAVRDGWSQQWRGPLREALELLRDGFDALFEAEGATLFADPWAARDRYVELVLDRGRRQSWLEGQGVVTADGGATRALTLLELQRNSLLMFTSCGWFFEELSGIEGVQILRYAARALQLARELYDGASPEHEAGRQRRDALEAAFMATLSKARSNLPQLGDGATVYRQYAATAVAPLSTIALHVVAGAAVELPLPGDGRFYGYDVRLDEPSSWTVAGLGERARGLALRGELTVSSSLTGATERFAYLVVGADPLPRAWVVPVGHDGSIAALLESLDEGTIAAQPGSRSLDLSRLFVDHRRKIVEQLMVRTMERRGDRPAQLLAQYSDLLAISIEHGVPPPPLLTAAAGDAIRERIEQALVAAIPGDAPSLRDTCRRARIEMTQARAHHFNLELIMLAPRLSKLLADSVAAALARLERAADSGASTDAAAAASAVDVDRLDACVELLELAHDLGVRPVLWTAQNGLWRFVTASTPLVSEPHAMVIDRLVRLAVWLGFDGTAVRSRLAQRNEQAASAVDGAANAARADGVGAPTVVEPAAAATRVAGTGAG